MSRAVKRAAGSQTPLKINFEYLTGLGGDAEQELRKTEDALLDYISAEQRREGLYDSAQKATREELIKKYPALSGQTRLPAAGEVSA